jgi:endonuclease YncB( thermonuclease family)
MIAGKTVKVNVKDTDRYGRFIGIVSTDKIKDVNLEMIKAGMAWHYSYYDNTPSYKLAQQQAKKGNKGLWQDPNPINPYEWRKKH